jgi:hypothetical protein
MDSYGPLRSDAAYCDSSDHSSDLQIWNSQRAWTAYDYANLSVRRAIASVNSASSL